MTPRSTMINCFRFAHGLGGEPASTSHHVRGRLSPDDALDAKTPHLGARG